MAKQIAAAALEKKALNVVILDLRKMETLTDFFVICTGEVNQHVRAIGEHIEDHVAATSGDRLLHREGMASLNWLLLDYVDVVVHVFRPSFREFYRLESLWGDADTIDVVEEPARKSPRTVRRKAAVRDVGAVTADVATEGAKGAAKKVPKKATSDKTKRTTSSATVRKTSPRTKVKETTSASKATTPKRSTPRRTKA